MKFLVVDDSVTMRRIIMNALQRIGYTDMIEAADGREALSRFDENIGFIITDWNKLHMLWLAILPVFALIAPRLASQAFSPRRRQRLPA